MLFLGNIHRQLTLPVHVAAVHDVLRKQADGSITSLDVGRQLYEFALFGMTTVALRRKIWRLH